MTQTEKILSRIKNHGHVDNFWAIDNYILRLGARIKDLRDDGIDIRSVNGRELGKEKKYHKNQYYFIVKKQETLF